MRNWDGKFLDSSTSFNSKNIKFDCERFIKLSEAERQKLIQLKKFSEFEWYTESK